MRINPSFRELGMWAMLVGLFSSAVPEARGVVSQTPDVALHAIEVLSKGGDPKKGAPSHSLSEEGEAIAAGRRRAGLTTDAELEALFNRLDPLDRRRLQALFQRLHRTKKLTFPPDLMNTVGETAEGLAKIILDYYEQNKNQFPEPPEDSPEAVETTPERPTPSVQPELPPANGPKGETGPLPPTQSPIPPGPTAKSPGRGLTPTGGGRPDPMQELEAILLKRQPSPRRISRETERKLTQREQLSARATPHLGPTPEPPQPSPPKEVAPSPASPVPSETPAVKVASPAEPASASAPSPFRFPLQLPVFRPLAPAVRQPASLLTLSTSPPPPPAAEPAPRPVTTWTTAAEPAPVPAEKIALTQPPSLTAKWALPFSPAPKVAASWVGLEKDLPVEEELPPGEEGPLAEGSVPDALAPPKAAGLSVPETLLVSTSGPCVRIRLAGAPEEESTGEAADEESPPADLSLPSRIGLITARIGAGFSWLLPQRADFIRFAQQSLGIEEAQAVRLYETVRLLAWAATALWFGGLLYQGLRWLPSAPSATGILVHREPGPGENE